MYANTWIFPDFTKYCKPMIDGHGDDIFRYGNIRMNFSSNICQHANLAALKAYLATRLNVIANYPEPEAWSLERLLARQLDIPEECVVVTSGATEAIYLVAQAFRYHYRFLSPSFSEYEDACAMYPPQSQHSGLWLCNPNNPTGDVYSREQILQWTKEYQLVVIDQSYEDYTDAPVLTSREAVAWGNVIQLHSLTKSYGIPGLRIGYVTAHSRLTAAIRRCLRPWAVNALAVEAGKFLLNEGTPLRPDLVEAHRLALMLEQTGFVRVTPSHTNFMLCEILSCSAAELKDYLARQHGMLIRDASNFKGLTARHFRVAAQSPEENDALVTAIREFMEEKRDA